MKNFILMASMVAGLATSPAFADPLGEILSLARRIGYGNGVVVERRPYVVEDDDYQYAPADGSYYYGRPRNRWGYVPTNSGASAGEGLLQMDYGELRRVARASNADFDRWLSGIPAGEVWRKHFQTRSIQELLASDVNAPPGAEDRGEIVRLLGIFDRAVATSELDDITRRDSARTLRASLRELSTSPDQRLVRQLSLSARMLNRSLGALNTGVSWQRYLALPDGIIAAVDRPPGDGEFRAEFNLEELGQILEHYDNVSESQEYQMIASFPDFQVTHQRLIELVNPTPSTPPTVPTAVAEELPPPELEAR